MSASLFVFRTATIDSNSVTEDNSGANLDFFAVSTDRLTSVSAIEDKIVLYFRESNTFENSSANQAKVTLNVTADNEYNTVVNIWKLTLQEDQIFSFDNVNSQYPLSTITSVDTIIRVTSERFTSGGGLPSGGDQYQTLVKQSATDGDVAWEYPDTLLLLVRNVSGGLLPKGTPVHENGVTGTVPDVIAADASIPSAMPATYVLIEDIANNAEGLAMITGIIENVDTSAFSPGDIIYVASGGGYTNIKPTGTDLIQNLGVVTKSNASTGSGVVYGTGRSNDVPNLPTGKFFIGSATNTVESAYTFPTADGTANQILQTDGLGTVSFVDETDTTYTAGDGLRLVGTEFSVLPKTNGGLVFESAALAVDLGATSITGTLGIGDGGTGQITQQAALDAITNATSGTTGQVLTTDGTNASWQTASASGIAAVVDDTTPQLGGNLDLNSNNITGTGNIDTTGTLGLTTTTTGDSLLITTTEDTADAAPVISLKRNSASPADGDYLGQLKFKGENDADQEVVYAKITGKISDVTDTTEDGLIEFALRKAGANNIGARLTSTDLKLINGTGLEVGGYSFPTSDGTSGQVLQTDGAGTLSFQTPSSGYKLLQTYSYSDTGTTDKFFVQNAITEISGTNAARDYRSAFAIPVAGSIDDCTMMGAVAVNGNAYRLYAWIDNTSTYYSEATGGNEAGGRYTVRWTAWKNVSDDSDAPDPSFSANSYLAFQLVPTGTLANPGSVSLCVLTSHT